MEIGKSKIDKYNIRLNNSGQALMPVVLLMFAAINIGAAMMVVSRLSVTNFLTVSEGVRALDAASSAMENGYIQILRDPGYTGEDISINDVDCTVTVVGDETTKTMAAECSYHQVIRQLHATLTYAGGVMEVSDEGEI